MHNTSLTKSDTEIVQQIIEGDIDAFENLMKRHQDLVVRIVKRHVRPNDIEDSIQDVFVRAYRSLHTFAHKGDFRHWISSIAIRTCHDYWRKVYRSKEVSMSALSEKHHHWLEAVLSNKSGQSIEEKGSQREAKELLDWALAKLSPEDRMVLELVYLEDLSVKDAAGLLGWSVTNVKVRSFRSRKKLKKLLRDLVMT
jgi:RNA polymerase sigma-70 factor (ECF subfamily)